MPAGYYALVAPDWLRQRHAGADAGAGGRKWRECRRRVPAAAAGWPARRTCCCPACCRDRRARSDGDVTLQELLDENGFDPELHEQIRSDLRAGRIGLAQNRLPANAVIEDVHAERRDLGRDGRGRRMPRAGRAGAGRRARWPW